MVDLGIELSNSTLITSKTDLQGRITYCNKDFIQYSGFSEQEVFGKPHNIVRHQDMPRVVFKTLWKYIKNGEEVFAFVKNKTKDRQYYWVLANVTPSLDANNNAIGYYSVRRKPNPKAIEKIIPLYAAMVAAEKTSLEASEALLNSILNEQNLPYNEWIFSMQENLA
ncbi:PAS domain-containing protein [Helicobacter apodemus]|uniref:Histidine kinase n=1 Tax=Helicobacter apodemus TaxID=135569 RepID=A0A2U8FFW6_9HELI|nr:PAS domain-containing protein [Helicobacter apodemus]AWI34956.1 histidine kinase [Helicobacter apodemus]